MFECLEPALMLHDNKSAQEIEIKSFTHYDENHWLFIG
jgi:hypothetical protein